MIPFWRQFIIRACIMKLLICVFAAFAVFGSISCQLYDDISRALNTPSLSSVAQLRSKLADIKPEIEKICLGKSDEFENITDNSIQCIGSFHIKYESLCSFSQKITDQCTGPFIKFFEGCLPANGKYLPGMVIDVLKKIESYLCQTDGEHLFELTNYCIANITPKTERCLNTIKARAQDHKIKEVLPSSQEICEQFVSMRPCLQSHLNGACGHPTTREMWLGIFDVVKSAVCVNSLKEIGHDIVMEPVVDNNL